MQRSAFARRGTAIPDPEQWEPVQQYLSTRLTAPAVLAIFEEIEGEHIKQAIQTLADPHRRN